MQSFIQFSFKNENVRDTVSFSGPELTMRDFRQKLRDRIGLSSDDFYCVLDENQRVLTMGDRLFNSSRVLIQRMGYYSSLCRSCYSQNAGLSSPCCKQPICGACDSRFNQTQRCPFFLNTSCQDLYRSSANSQMQTEISFQELDKIIKDAAFFIVKSNNDQNVQIAKSQNIWATTQKNFKRLIQAFNQNQQVVLIFTANRIDKFLGCARMKNTQDQNTQKQWQGASQIMLADNFGIEWLRRGKLDFAALQDTPNPLTGESVTKSRDCQEVPKDIGRTICMGFDQIRPEESFHEFQQQQQPGNFQSNANYKQPQFEPIDSPPPARAEEPLQQQQQQSQSQQQNNEEEDEWDYDDILGRDQNKQTPAGEQPQSPGQTAASKPQRAAQQQQQPRAASPVMQQAVASKQSPKRSNSSKSSNSSEEKNQQKEQMMQQEMLQQMMLMQMQPQFMVQMAMQQQMEKWNNMNKGKIPGLTGKIQYAHPYLVTIMQKMSQGQQQAIRKHNYIARNPPSDEEKHESKRRRSRPKSHHKKSKRSKSHKKKRSRSRDKKKSHRKH